MTRRKKQRTRSPERKTFDALSVTKHQGTGLGYLRLGGKRVYVGPFDSPDLERRARRAYDRWRAGPAAEDGVTIARLIDLYLEHDAEVRYSKGGKATSALTRCRVALQRLSDLFGDLPAETFRQQDFRAYWIDVLERPPGGGEKIMRDTAARYAAAVKDLFVWGGTHGYITDEPRRRLEGQRISKLLAPSDVELAAGRPVKPVNDKVVEKTMPHLPPVVADMVRLQRLTGMRPGEVTQIRGRMIDTSAGDVWVYRPEHHKTEHRGKLREIAIGPRAQAILKPYLKGDPSAPLFQPAESEAARLAELHRQRKTPMTPSQQARQEATRMRIRARPPGEEYDSGSYRRAVQRAAEAAGVEVWSPNQLRHSYATELLAERFEVLGKIGATLGHARPATTRRYTEALVAAMSIAREVG